MKLRIMGLPDEIDGAIEALNDTPDLDMIEVNGPYPNRGNSRMVRVYIEVRLSRWCGRAWHDGDCCEGSRAQWHPAHRAIPHVQRPELPS